MSRLNPKIVVLVIFALAGIALKSALMTPKAENNKPNLLFIMTDQQRYDALSIAGNDELETPNLDRLAKQGAYFKNAYPEKIKYMISNYCGLVREIDDWVGEILKKLDELGLAENTLVIFTSDHGEMLGAHGMREKNVFYEESAHIPLLIRFPNKIKSNTRVDGYVSNIDLFSTILDYLEIGSHKSDGKSLHGLMDGN